jgi:hypothetical protein
MAHEDALKLIESINAVHSVLFVIMVQLAGVISVIIFKD